MSSSTAVVAIVSGDELKTHITETVDFLAQSPIDQINKLWFNRAIAKGSDAKVTLNEIVTGLAKSKKTDDQVKIAKRIQTFLDGTPLKEYDVMGRIYKVWEQQQAAYDALTPEELKAYNELTPEQLAEHYF